MMGTRELVGCASGEIGDRREKKREEQHYLLLPQTTVLRRWQVVIFLSLSFSLLLHSNSGFIAKEW
jgi:hypothetical protein